MGTNIGGWKPPSAPPMEAGTYVARCTGVIDLGVQKTTWEGKERLTPQILLIFEFPTELIEYDGEKRPRWISQKYTKSIDPKAKLRHHLQAWRGCDFTDQEMHDFDIARVLNAACTIVVSHTEKNGNYYANISSIGQMMKGIPTPADVVKQFHFDIDDEGTWACFADLPEWIQALINGSETFREAGIQISKDGKRVDVASSKTAETGNQIPASYDELDMDDGELPF